jgi:uncharacterized SAM-binding protein YcdF (DUF218 family)
MFFVLSKILDFFLQPICWIIILLIISFIFSSTKLKRSLIGCSLLIILILSNGIFTNLFYNQWEVPYPKENNQKYEIGIVLTGGIIQSSQPKGYLVHLGPHADRLFQAAQLYKKGTIKKIMITGGNVSIAGNLIKDSTNETLKSAQLLRTIGIPDSSIILELKARNTHENAVYSKELLIQLHATASKIALITSADHMKRSAACFTKVGIQFDVFPAVKIGKDAFSGILNDFVPDERNIYINALLLREIAGYYIYKIMGYC